MSHSPTVESLVELIREARLVVVLTGAGISTSSGLPDYRSSAGLWRDRRFEQLASIDSFREEPTEFWAFYRERLDAVRRAEPTVGHLVLARLVEAGHIAAIITQNVDGLHAAAGCEALEVHGSLRRATCLTCAWSPDMDLTLELASASADGIPYCRCGEVLKPDVTLFGELLHADIEPAFEKCQQADLLIACGTSLEVAPVCHLPMVTQSGGGQVVLVNVAPTAADIIADLVVRGTTDEVLTRVVERLLPDTTAT